MQPLGFAGAADGGIHAALGGDGFGQGGAVTLHRGQDLGAGHGQHGIGLDHHALAVVFQHDLAARIQLRPGEYAVGHEHRDVLFVQQMGHAVGGGGVVEQAPLLRGLADPGVVVAVAVEDDALVVADGLLDQRVQGVLEVLLPLQPVGKNLQALGHGGVEHDVGAGDGVARAQHAELKLVAGEGEGRGAVAVGGVPGEARQHVDAQTHGDLLLRVVGGIGLDRLQHGVQLVAEEHGHHGGRGLVGAQPVVVAGGGHGQAQQILIVVHRLDHRAQEQQELGVLIGRLARREQVHARIRGHGPVVVLAGAVDAGEGLLVQQTHQIVPGSHLLHDLHGELVVVGGQVGGGIDGRQLMLGGGDLVVLGLRQDAQLPELLVQILHVGRHLGLDDAEVVVVHLLALGGLRTEQGASGQTQIQPLVIQSAGNQEVFLLRADGGGHPLDRGIAEQTQDAQGLAVEGLHGAQQGRLLVQGLAAVGAEGRGDAQGLPLDEGIGGGVPGGVAPGLKGGAQAA